MAVMMEQAVLDREEENIKMHADIHGLQESTQDLQIMDSELDAHEREFLLGHYVSCIKLYGAKKKLFKMKATLLYFLKSHMKITLLEFCKSRMQATMLEFHKFQMKATTLEFYKSQMLDFGKSQMKSTMLDYVQSLVGVDHLPEECKNWLVESDHDITDAFDDAKKFLKKNKKLKKTYKKKKKLKKNCMKLLEEVVGVLTDDDESEDEDFQSEEPEEEEFQSEEPEHEEFEDEDAQSEEPEDEDIQSEEPDEELQSEDSEDEELTDNEDEDLRSEEPENEELQSEESEDEESSTDDEEYPYTDMDSFSAMIKRLEAMEDEIDKKLYKLRKANASQNLAWARYGCKVLFKMKATVLEFSKSQMKPTKVLDFLTSVRALDPPEICKSWLLQKEAEWDIARAYHDAKKSLKKNEECEKFHIMRLQELLGVEYQEDGEYAYTDTKSFASLMKRLKVMEDEIEKMLEGKRK